MYRIKKILNLFLGYLHFFRVAYLLNKIINEVNVVFFFPYYHTGGAERVHASIVASLAPQKSLVLFTKASATDAVLADFKLYAETIELNPILNKKNARLNAFLRKFLVHKINKSNSVKKIFSSNSDYFYELVPDLSTSKMLVDLFHAFSPNDYRTKLVVTSAPFISKRIVINQAAKKTVEQFYQFAGIESFTARIQIISNGIELPQTIDKSKKRPIKIGFVGRWSEEKRPELFLKAAQIIKSKHPEINFFMAGSGTKVNQKLIENHGVEYLGDIHDSKKLGALYEETSILVLTSVYEGFPMVFMEGMSHGCVPVSTNVGGIADHIQSKVNGLLIEASNEPDILEELIECLLYLISHAKELENMGKNCKDYASTHFSIQQFNKAYQKLLQ